ncbi:MAG: phosphoethanolamine transferase domain-containing protein [Promethearchaeota archaeon]
MIIPGTIRKIPAGATHPIKNKANNKFLFIIFSLVSSVFVYFLYKYELTIIIDSVVKNIVITN